MLAHSRAVMLARRFKFLLWQDRTKEITHSPNKTLSTTPEFTLMKKLGNLKSWASCKGNQPQIWGSAPPLPQEEEEGKKVHLITNLRAFGFNRIYPGYFYFSEFNLILLLFSCPKLSNSLPPHGPQHTRFSCPSPTPRACSNSWSIELVMRSNHLIFCHPLLRLSSIFSSIMVFSSEPVLGIWWPKN